MALHRDIYWVGRQWAVTGFGVQAVDQRLKGAFDIEACHIWDDDLPRKMRALAWLKADDFDKALDIARARHPEPPRKSLPLVESILEMIPSAVRNEAPRASASLRAPGPPRPAKAPALAPSHGEAGLPADFAAVEAETRASGPSPNALAAEPAESPEPAAAQQPPPDFAPLGCGSNTPRQSSCRDGACGTDETTIDGH